MLCEHCGTRIKASLIFCENCGYPISIVSTPSGHVYKKPWRALAGWFLGPRAENRELFTNLVMETMNWYADCREQYFPMDPCYFTDEVLHSHEFNGEINILKQKLKNMQVDLAKSIPFFSTRYQGHMLWDVTMPSLLGYISGLLWNANNVDSSISPVTTQMEIAVGQQLCSIMEFKFLECEVPPGATSTPPTSWGHITSCGTVANLEAMWSARNLKFHPVAVKNAVTDEIILNTYPELSSCGDFEVYVPSIDGKKLLRDCTSWELLNLRIYDVCRLTYEMKQTLTEEARNSLDKATNEFSLITNGFYEFMRKNSLNQSPVLTAAGSKHYSWDKSATVLGMGNKAVIPIPVDNNCRQDLNYLEEQLQHCLNNQVPLLMVVVVHGSTEESSVDNLKKVIELRKCYMKKGLNFSIHVDGAWGGYFKTMLRKPCANRPISRKIRIGHDFVPVIPLSDYATEQYMNLSFADTITIDPHKSGFCPYPAGGLLYRDGMMKDFITLKAPEVCHGENEISIGVFGLEGSKPGAAAAGVLLSHQVIGLDQSGYGRILGQCQLGSKLFYCLWMTVAKEFDDFVCINFIDLPWDILDENDFPTTLDGVKNFIREHILGKEDIELQEDEKAMKFLQIVGPDALINTFAVNLNGNDDLKVCNRIQNKMFEALNVKVGKTPKRTEMFVTSGTLAYDHYGTSMNQFKQRLGLQQDQDELRFLRTTAMGPFQCSDIYLVSLGSIFRRTCMKVIASIKDYGDAPIQHDFIVTKVTRNGKLFVEYIPSFEEKEKQYHLVMTMRIAQTDNDDIEFMRDLVSHGNVFLRNVKPEIIFDITESESPRDMEVLDSLNGGRCLRRITMRVDEVYKFEHLEKPQNADHFDYPAHAEYYMYGDDKNVFLSHVVTKFPDFFQVIELRERPHSVLLEFIDLGLVVTLPEVSGYPKLSSEGQMLDPLDATHYDALYRGKKYVKCKTTLRIKKSIIFKRLTKKSSH